jgi:hypothetical protein
MNSRQRRLVRRAEARIDAAEAASCQIEWADGYAPDPHVSDRVMVLVLRARHRRRWPIPKAFAPQFFRDPAAYGHRCFACGRKAVGADDARPLRWACREHGEWVPF